MDPNRTRESSGPASRGPVGASSQHGRSAIRGGATRVLGYAGGVLVSLATATILVRHLGIAGFGRFLTVTSLIAVVGGISEAGIYLYGIREFVRRNDAERRSMMANLLGLRLTLASVGIGVAVVFALVAGYRSVLLIGAMLVGAGLLVQVTADVLSIPLQADLRLGTLTIVDLTRRLTALALVAALALVGAGLLPLFSVSFGSCLIALMLLAWLLRSSAAVRVGVAREAWRELFAETLPYAIAMSIGAIYFYVTVILMSLIASAHQTGLFSTSFRVTQVALGVPALLLISIFPVMSRLEGDDGLTGEILGKVFVVAVICGVWMSLVTALGASFIIDVVAGSKGRGAVPVLRIQGLVLTLSFISTSSALALISLRRFRTLIVTGSCSLALNIALGLALVPTLGAKGGALADVLTEAVAALALTLVVIRAVPRHQIKASALPPVLLAAALSASVLLLPIGALGHAAAATVIYFAVLLLTGSIPDELTAAARSARRPQSQP
jgi:O-antigen/teichoic acid export membrane protein